MSTQPKIQYEAIRGEVMPRDEWEREYAELVRDWKEHQRLHPPLPPDEDGTRQKRMRGQRSRRRTP